MDVLTGPCPPFLSDFIKPLATKLSLPTLERHFHHVLYALVGYQTVYTVISPALACRFLPGYYNSFNKRTKINWDVHVVSLVQAFFICTLALWGIFYDEGREGWTEPEDASLYRVFGYTVTGGAVQGYATGYFVWDLIISVWHLDIMGLGFVAHAFCALAVFSLGFKPFVNYYAPIFILFELSNPFLNVHWFCDKLKLTGSMIQLVNGFFLLGTFFGCRIAWGTYNSVLVFKDIFSIYLNPPAVTHPSPESLLAHDATIDAKVVSHPFAGKEVPLWLAVVYLGSNLVLNGLNYYWFSRMIQTVSARFKSDTKKQKVEDEKVWVEGTDMDIGTPVDIAKKELDLKRRQTKTKA